MAASGPLKNPFPGLRPFEADEEHLFFGRERLTDDLLRKLRANRFLFITGASGAGKSSLVRCGLVASLQSGMMANTGSHWQIATMRPSADPIGNLAKALSAAAEGAPVAPMLLEVTLRRGSLGLVEVIRQARIDEHTSVLLVVDQFEEIFRFLARSKSDQAANNDAAAFVNLLLEASGQEQVPIFVVLTMRADFIGECMSFRNLPDAINVGQFLVPRMTRDQLRSSITGPVAVAGGRIAPRLVSRLLNECGDDFDQLPILQHALMRTWGHWTQNGQTETVIDFADYEAIGTLQHALSRHAEEALADAPQEGKTTAERMFKALVDTTGEGKWARRPTSVADLARICEVSEPEIIAMADLFRHPGRLLLTPAGSTALEASSVVDLSHESLMRCWSRLLKWTEEEHASTRQYLQLVRDARAFDEGKAGLWRSPELDLAIRWLEGNRPNLAWAERIDPDWQRAIRFLNASRLEKDRGSTERATEMRNKLRWAWTAASALGLLFVITLSFAVLAFSQRNRSRHDFHLAKESLNSVLSSESAVIPFEKVSERLHGAGAGPALDEETALIDMRLGDAERVKGNAAAAVEKYKLAISNLRQLCAASPQDTRLKMLLAEAYNGLGEAQRTLPGLASPAEISYDQALGLLREATGLDPGKPEYRLATARTYYNRSVVYQEENRIDDAQLGLNQSIQVLTPLALAEKSPVYRRELASAKNKLAQLISAANLPGDPIALQQEAVTAALELIKTDPANREYKFELAQYLNNSAILWQSRDKLPVARTQNEEAIALLQQMAEPLPPLKIRLGLSYQIRGRILEASGSRLAVDEYQRSLDTLRQVPAESRNNEFRTWYGNGLFNMAKLMQKRRNFSSAAALLVQALEQHRSLGSNYYRAWDYCALANSYRRMRARQQLQSVLEDLRITIPLVPEADRPNLSSCLAGEQR